MRNLSLSRRCVMGMLLGALALLPKTSQAARAAERVVTSPQSFAPGSLLKHPKSATLVGEAFLNKYPQERDAEKLLRNLFKGRPFPQYREGSVAQRKQLESLAEEIRTDFKAARVVEVDGWILSVTEARLCAVIALL